jgi:YfiH family protein
MTLVPTAMPASSSILQFSSFHNIRGLRHAVTTRSGGTSTRPYASLNLGFHVSDEKNSVQQNRQIAARSLGIDAAHVVAMQQTHSTNVQMVTQAEAGRGALDWQSGIPDTDALITAKVNVPLLILVADCAPLLLADPVNRVLAVVHAGWRGAVARIASKAVLQMAQRFGSKPEDVRIGVGPCLCASCFEVGDEVVTAASEIAPHAVLHDYEKPHLDLREVLRADLMQHRVLDTNIEIMTRCPRCENATFFSHRGESGTTGRFGLYAWWEK